MSTTTRIIEPGQIEAPAGQIPFLRLAEPDVFKQRAERFRQLSQQHSFGAYLSFLATLAQAQHEVLTHFPAVPLPYARTAGIVPRTRHAGARRAGVAQGRRVARWTESDPASHDGCPPARSRKRGRRPLDEDQRGRTGGDREQVAGG